MTATPPPSPETATDAATLMAALRRLKTWSGLSFRQLDRRAADAGDTLPYSTASTMLAKDRVPREELLAAFVRACGLDGDDLRPWLAARARIAVGDPAPVAHRRSPRRLLLAAAALAVALAAGAGLTTALHGDEQNVDVQISTTY
ncbi:hypothetical protein FH608_008715 [Nonomuraea phyllanthi]|uniref:Uncharacterized protein n=2 Tax=Nonomuraea phyllanthi TaxID=2219224 RepID=A0A5C4WUA5_9ACTN|nr:hypothetical protein FH608_008715 [Nonomuraea phyllanthi]QFY15011.1 hypothetical protein GBF35_49235 [Nonomuraea phyllanthi]